MSAKCFLFMRLFLLAISIPVAVPSTVAAQNNTTVTGDRLALLAIKSLIKHDPNGVLTSWDHSTTNFCQWQGVTCGVRHQRVTRLEFPPVGLNGTLSPFIGNLSFLNVIWLGGNSFSGEIPPEIGRLFRLRELDLFDNSFSGEIPPEIGRLFRLQELDLSYNSFSGEIPPEIGRLFRLQELDLSYNSFSGEIPPEIGRLFRLRELWLSYNFLEGNIPPSLYNCSSLERVYLPYNQLTGNLHANLSSLMPSLQYLSLSHNHIQGNFLHIPATLEVLDLSFNDFGGRLPSLNDSFLRNLNLSNNLFVGSLALLEIPETLTVVDFSYNQFWGSLREMLCSNGTKRIKALNLGNNQLSGVIPECWEKWSSLVLLNLENNNFSGELPRTLGLMPSLELLSMHGNKISGRLPSSLMNLSNLTVLQLGRNNLVGTIPAWIGIKLTLLKILNLRSNKFYGNIPHEICHLSHVQILDLAHNNMFGNIPGCIKNFRVISGIETNTNVQISIDYGEHDAAMVGDSLLIKGREDTYRVFLGLVMLLDLSSNNFSGQIPSELTTLQKLKSLNLSRNQLTGKIPDKIGDMKELESFDLSVNKLFGELPKSLSKLNFISSFNVSYNNLKGRIPTSTQIQSLDASNFFGNKLCGAPLNSDCVLDDGDAVGDQQEDNESHGADWGLIISVGLGFVVGFWVIVAPLIVNKSWRIIYFHLLSKLI